MPLGGKLFSPPTKAKNKARDEAAAGTGSTSKSDVSDPEQEQKAKLPKRSGSLKFSFKKRIKDVVKDLESKSGQPEVGPYSISNHFFTFLCPFC